MYYNKISQFFGVVFFVLTSSTFATIPTLERDALIALHQSMQFDLLNSNLSEVNEKLNWLGAVGTECNWVGVTCDETQSKVIGLNIDMRGIGFASTVEVDYNGSLPTELNNLTALTHLSIHVFLLELKGNLPNLDQLTQLQEIELFNLQLTGTVPTFKNAPFLEKINLSLNRLTGNIPDFRNLTKLEKLHLSNNQLSGTVNFIPENLKEIDISNNQCLQPLNDRIEQNVISLAFSLFGGPVDNWNTQDCSMPIANNDIISVPLGSISFNILENDILGGKVNSTSIDLNPLTDNQETIITIPDEGEWKVDNIGFIHFTPLANFKQNPTPISYTVKNSINPSLRSEPKTITIIYPPIAINDISENNPAGSVQINVIENDQNNINSIEVEIDLNLISDDVQSQLIVKGEGRWEVDNIKGIVTFIPFDDFKQNPSPIYYNMVSTISTLSIKTYRTNNASITLSYAETEPLDNNQNREEGVAFINVNGELTVPAVQAFGGYYSAKLKSVKTTKGILWKLLSVEFLGKEKRSSQTTYNISNSSISFRPLRVLRADNSVESEKDLDLENYLLTNNKTYFREITENLSVVAEIKDLDNVNCTLERNSKDMALFDQDLFVDEDLSDFRRFQLFVPSILYFDQLYSGKFQKVSEINGKNNHYTFWNLLDQQLLSNDLPQNSCNFMDSELLNGYFINALHINKNQKIYYQDKKLDFLFLDEEGVGYWVEVNPL